MQIYLYIHFPFCLNKCLYCDFNSVAGSQIAPEDYVTAVIKEMELRAEELPAQVTAPTLYFGGGTPSLMEPVLVERIIATAARLYGLQSKAEITIEANPGTLNPAKLAGYRSAGINRLSLGIQSFNDRMLAQLGRIHTARQALSAFHAAREAGFANIGIDLIHSLPRETPVEWLEELSAGIQLAPEHISAYGLTIEEGTPFHSLYHAGALTLPDEEAAAQMFRSTADSLEEAGYEHYEISNFARPGFRSRHNQIYWRRDCYFGFGAGAHSFTNALGYGRRWKNIDDPAEYLAVADKKPIEEDLTELGRKDAMAERLFLGLRMLEGIDGARFTAEFGATVEEAYPAELPGLLANGLLEWKEERLCLTKRGVIMYNQVVMKFV